MTCCSGAWIGPRLDDVERLVGEPENDAVALRVLHREGALVEQRRRRGDEGDAVLLDPRAQHIERIGITAGEGGEAQLVGAALGKQHLARGTAADESCAEFFYLHFDGAAVEFRKRGGVCAFQLKMMQISAGGDSE